MPASTQLSAAMSEIVDIHNLFLQVRNAVDLYDDVKGQIHNSSSSVLDQEAQNSAAHLVSKSAITEGRCLTAELLRKVLNGLVEAWKSQQQKPSAGITSLQELDLADAELWFAGKRLDPKERLSRYLGSNEKSKAVLILQEKGDPRPARERAVNETDMLAWQFEQQQMQAALEADAEVCTTSAWADPHLMKHQLNGLNNVRWR